MSLLKRGGRNAAEMSFSREVKGTRASPKGLLNQFMKRHPGCAGVVAFSAALAACARQRMKAEADSIFAEMRRQQVAPNEFTYNALLSLTSDVFEFEQVLREMTDARVACTKHTYAVAVRQLVKFGEMRAVQAVIEGMAASGFPPDAMTIAPALRAYDFDSGINVHRQFVTHQPQYHRMLDGHATSLYSIARDRQQILAVDVLAATSGLTLDRITAYARCKALLRCGHPEMVLHSYQTGFLRAVDGAKRAYLAVRTTAALLPLLHPETRASVLDSAEPMKWIAEEGFPVDRCAVAAALIELYTVLEDVPSAQRVVAVLQKAEVPTTIPLVAAYQTLLVNAGRYRDLAPDQEFASSSKRERHYAKPHALRQKRGT